MLKLKIKKGDKVQVIAGSDKGKKGTVVEVNPTALKIKVEILQLISPFFANWPFFKALNAVSSSLKNKITSSALGL